ncbi:hypothetical protein Y032_0002g990 [Ancylostoma ceylanicum]|uniref:U3 small nucleolar RNA-associated protein 6 n=1 Tax=Ancylostoma ceylanicum TaxID=53326 RepID=A0A016W1P9_9BILA|nr:hypothetical protein Y032_0002g990 [Ancylostoma ceylanicum]
MLVEMWKECNKVELVRNIDTVRSFVVEKLKEFDNEDTRLFEIEAACKEGTSKFDAFDVALSKTPTEKMHRLYLKWLRESSTKDSFSDMKIRSLLRSMCDGDWMTEKDWRDLEGCMQEAEEEFDESFIEKCLEKRPQSSVFWSTYLEKRLKNNVAVDEFRDLCNRALEKIDPEESFPIWQHAIDHSIMFAPNEVEQVFYDAMKKANTSVASKIKMLFVDYLNQLFEDGKITQEQLKERLMELVNSKPNSGEFYCHVHRKELERSNPDTKFAGFVLKSAVIEECATVEAVILYAKWTMKYDVSNFHVVHQTGLKLFKGSELDEFVVRWTQLVQEAAAEAIKSERRVDKAKKKKIVKKVPIKEKKKCLCDSENLTKHKDLKKNRKRRGLPRKAVGLR